MVVVVVVVVVVLVVLVVTWNGSVSTHSAEKKPSTSLSSSVTSVVLGSALEHSWHPFSGPRITNDLHSEWDRHRTAQA